MFLKIFHVSIGKSKRSLYLNISGGISKKKHFAFSDMRASMRPSSV